VGQENQEIMLFGNPGGQPVVKAPQVDSSEDDDSAFCNRMDLLNPDEKEKLSKK